jgi:Zn-finger nucleic acid-binding protein
MECPGCKAVLGPVPFETGRILFCSQCSGIWVEGDQVAEVLGNLPETSESLPGTEKHCPNCSGSKFHSVRLPGVEVVIDICPECRGIWFDPGEFPVLRRLCQKGSEREEPISARVADWVTNTLAGLLGRY